MTRLRGPHVGFVLALTGCSSYLDAARDLKATHPHAALEYVVRDLADDPADEVGRALLSEITSAIAQEHSLTIDRLAAEKRYDAAVAECDRVIATSDLVGRVGGDVFHDPWNERRAFAGRAFDDAVEHEQQIRAANTDEAKRLAAEAAMQVRRWVSWPTGSGGRYSH